MTTYAGLVKEVGRDTGTLPNWSTFTTLTGASERALKIAAWVNEAWLNLQNERDDWFWRRATFTAALTAAQSVYVGATITGSARFGSWINDSPNLYSFSIYDTSDGVADEHFITQMDYEEWFETYGRGPASDDTGRPIHWSIRINDGALVLSPIPTAGFTLRGRYVKSPQTLAADIDEPEAPARYHNLIKWEAIRLLQLNDGGFDESGLAAMQIATLRAQLMREQLPNIYLGGGSIGA